MDPTFFRKYADIITEAERNDSKHNNATTGFDALDEMSPYDPYGDDAKVDAINAANPPKATAGRLVPGMSGTPGKSRQTTPIPQKSNSIDLDAWDKAHGRSKVNDSIEQQNRELGYSGTMQSWQNSLDAKDRAAEQARLNAMFPAKNPQANKPPVMKK